ncbi:YdcF family protein [Novosphingobium sp. fls2-241-R2A-195]|uniref:YdcF family protein n=1 Tax=Novosphingobium sp. fls2-241-R2A-195 TaxID=3040296 RepID=UPI002549CA97|nr:YdcF family protein [Novosphingobium sp. fls2-241-R2A-195]
MAAVAVAAALSLTTVCASAQGARAQAVRDTVTESLSQRLFPLFDALGRDPAALNALQARPEVAAMLRARFDRRAACGTDLGCVAQAMVWTDGEAQVLAAAASGKAADDGPAAQAGREIAGINTIVRTYGLGQVPSYPGIDGAGMVDPQEARSRLQAATWLSQTVRANSVQALDPSLDYALALLDAADRRDAISYEPLTGGLNTPAFRRAKGLDWKRYRYSALIVTGVGPEVAGMPLSPYGKYHVRLAAQRFAAGDAPFLILTGGHAHPRATAFAEAEEMRRALIERYGVPAEAIVIEPHARHTTTNLRNASRLLMAMGTPLDKDTLIVCNPDQSAMIENPEFAARNNRELGYQPGTIGARVSPTELEFRPSALSARVDPRDPLDP